MRSPQNFAVSTTVDMSGNSAQRVTFVTADGCSLPTASIGERRADI
jgi:hypothetical protein